MNSMNIRMSNPADFAAIYALYPAAFPGEDLLALVQDLVPDTEQVLSLVAEIASTIVGHVAFSRCGLQGADATVSLLAPLAVSPASQGAGVGSALVRAGLELLNTEDVNAVLVLGDPAYYKRFGFKATEAIAPPYPLPPEYAGAWQLLELDPEATQLSGELLVPEQWRQPALWS